MAYGMLWFAERFIQTCQVEMRIGEIRIRGERLEVSLHGLLVSGGILQQNTQVEEQRRVRLALDRPRDAIDPS
jgi:hypothetical protein